MPRSRRYAFGVTGITIDDFLEAEEEEEYDAQEDEEEDTEDEEEDDEEEHQIREYIEVSDSPRISQNVIEEKDYLKRSKGGEEGVCSTSGTQGENEDTEGLICMICMEAWTSGDDHQLCCLPCGHLYGFSCIKKWLQLRRSRGKCPQCKRICSLKDIRKIYASRIVAVDNEAQKRILFLETKLSAIEKTNESWSNKETQWRKMEAELRSEVNNLKKKISIMESTAKGSQIDYDVAFQGQFIPGIGKRHRPASSCSFRNQAEMPICGGRIFDIDGGREFVLLARRQPGAAGTFVLTQMSLISGWKDDILLPPTTRAIKDVQLSPHNNGLAVFASLGKNLSVLSWESHNTVLSYNLPAAPWSCSWDLNSSHHIYAGLQNGMVLVFDTRQTTGPFASLSGLTTNPVHTIHNLSANSSPTSDVHSLLSASSIGLCQWNINGREGRSSLVTETGNPGVCISSSYSPRSDHVVASYRPRVVSSNDVTMPTQTGVNNYRTDVDGLHVSLNRRGIDSSQYEKLASTHALVDAIRLPRTAIIDFGDERKQLFASCEESSHELVLQDASSFVVSQRLPLSSHNPLQDVKYTNVNGYSLLGLLTDDRLQLLRNEP